MSRITEKFARLKQAQQKALIPFIMGGDPDLAWSAELLLALPQAGADLIELGMPFSDPMADGPVIQQAGLRALQAGVNLSDILALVTKFRTQDQQTPIILMGYYNPIFHYGVDRFLQEALKAGVDGLIIVDVPMEEDVELCLPAQKAGLDFIRMITPTTDSARVQAILQNATGFVYSVAVTGITGGKKAQHNSMAGLAGAIKQHSDLPAAIGFGIKTAEDAKQASQFFDAVVVGSALVEMIKQYDKSEAKKRILQLVGEMKKAIEI